MAEPARAADRISTAPAFTPEAVAELNARFADASPADMLQQMLRSIAPGRIALVSSFGAESAVLLHLVAGVDRSVPLIFVNTQKMFGDTLAYRDELAERLGFTDLRVVRPDPYVLAQRDATGLRWSYDPDGCCAIRKVEPLSRALGGFDAWISGRKGFQAGRSNLPHIMGVSVSETTMETTTAMVSVSANSRNSRPTTPGMRSSGMNTATSEAVSETTVKPIWRAPS